MRAPPNIFLAAVVTALALAACGGASSSSHIASRSSSAAASTGAASSSATSAAAGTQVSYEGVPIENGSDLAPASITQTATIDGIRCGSTEQLAYHIHAHLAVFVAGAIRALPAGIGIPGSSTTQTPQGPVATGGQCIYWLHTHTADGIIHIESPTQRIYTLGNLFDVWHQPLSADQVGTVHGHITALVNGRAWAKSPRSIPLLPHGLIQLEIGQPVPPLLSVNWSQTGL